MDYELNNKILNEKLIELNKASHKSVSLYHKFAIYNNISDSALGVLYALLEANFKCSQYDLCNKWSIPKQTVNTTVLSLQKKGLISLEHVDGSRNKKYITLTQKGREFVDNNITKLYEMEKEALKELTLKEIEIYVNLNNKYNEALAKKINSLLLLNEENQNGIN